LLLGVLGLEEATTQKEGREEKTPTPKTAAVGEGNSREKRGGGSFTQKPLVRETKPAWGQKLMLSGTH